MSLIVGQLLTADRFECLGELLDIALGVCGGEADSEPCAAVGDGGWSDRGDKESLFGEESGRVECGGGRADDHRDDGSNDGWGVEFEVDEVLSELSGELFEVCSSVGFELDQFESFGGGGAGGWWDGGRKDLCSGVVPEVIDECPATDDESSGGSDGLAERPDPQSDLVFDSERFAAPASVLTEYSGCVGFVDEQHGVVGFGELAK